VVFNPLKEKEVSQIVEIELLKLTTRLEDMNYNITISKTVKEFISNVGFDEKYGARPIKRAIQEKIEDLISEEVLRGTITENKPFILDMKDEEELIVKKGN
jgi:ATP-dependent Clp protease ATP-binding subunit ClpC